MSIFNYLFVSHVKHFVKFFYFINLSVNYEQTVCVYTILITSLNVFCPRPEKHRTSLTAYVLNVGHSGIFIHV